jgi:hypothetical protein
MLEIIALIFITRDIGKLAFKKGLNPGRWKLYTVLAWFAGEVPAVLVGFMIFGTDNLISVELVGIAGAITGLLILRAALLKKPDAVAEDDIDRMGNNT